jgi:hypothetical protein
MKSNINNNILMVKMAKIVLCNKYWNNGIQANVIILMTIMWKITENNQ